MFTLRNRFRSSLAIALASAFLLGGCGGSQNNAASGVLTGRETTCNAAIKNRNLANLTSPVCVTDEFRQPPAPVTKKVDLLFVVDNSESMNRHWQLMAAKIGHLIHEMPAGQDIRFAVILGSIQKNTGVLFSAPGVAKVLDGTKMNADQISAALSKTFAEAMNDRNVDWIGAGEALVYSTYYAATKHAKEIQAQGFFRPDAGLDIIFMSDDADESYPYPAKQFWDLPAKCNYAHHERMRRTYHVPRHIDVDTTFSALKQLKGDQPVITNAFVNITRADILVDNKLSAKCIFDSPGLGYFQIVKKTNGILYSIHGDRGEGLRRAGRLLAERLDLIHDFTLSKPASLVDPASISVTVDGKSAAHTYDATTNIVHVENAGAAGSLVDIHHCEPEAEPTWEIANFTGTAGQTTAGLTWNTGAVATDGKVLYGTDPAALNDVANDTVNGAGHSVSVTGLTPNTAYYFQAVSKDSAGTEKRSEVISLHTQPDWAITGLSAQASRTSASVSWQTSAYGTFGRVAWGTSANNLSNVSPETAQSSDHVVVINGLAPATTYYFQAISRDEFGLEKRSAVVAAKTVSDWSIIGFAGTVSRNSAALQWQTPDYPTASYLQYGLSPNALTNKVDAGSGTIPHSANVTGLTAGTTYYFQAVAADDVDGVPKKSAVIALTTIADWTLGDLTLASTETSFTANYTTSGYPTVGQIVWGASADALTNVVDAGNGDNHLATVSGLNPDTDYYVQAVAHDDLGVEKRGAVQKIRTQQIPLPVWAITGITSGATTGSITIGWNTTDYPTTGLVRYGKSPDALNSSVSECAASTAHSLSFAGLDPDTLYYVQIVAHDDRGQEQSSAVFAVRTQALPLPVWNIANLTGTPAQTSVTLTWDTDYPTTGTIYWGTSSSLGNTVAEGNTSTAHSFTVNGLNPDTDYYFRVMASDDRNQSKLSAIVMVHTQAVPLPVWSITGFAGTADVHSVALVWNTLDYATKGKVRYGTSATNLNQETSVEANAATTHSVNVTGLAAVTTYYFQVVATDDRGQEKTSEVISVTTTKVNPTWSITGFDGTTTTTSATMIWQTGVAAKGLLEIGLSPTDFSFRAVNLPAYNTSQILTVQGLSPNTTYYFRVTATDQDGGVVVSNVISKTTKASR